MSGSILLQLILATVLGAGIRFRHFLGRFAPAVFPKKGSDSALPASPAEE